MKFNKMGPLTISDLAVESNGHCLICLSLISPGVSALKQNTGLPGSHPQFPIHSIQSLSSYLKLDTSVVFKVNKSKSQHLPRGVGKSRLKVQLCKKCSHWVDKFSKLYRDLEKIQMELALSLRHISEMLTESEKGKAGQKIMKMAGKLNPAEDWKGKINILMDLRNEMMKKCSSVLQAVSPQVKVLNMGIKQIIKEKLKLKNSPYLVGSHVDQGQFNLPNSYPESLSDLVNEIDNGDIKVEQPLPDTILDDDDDPDYFPEYMQQSDDENEMSSTIQSFQTENTQAELKPDISDNKPRRSFRRRTTRKNNSRTIIKKAKQRRRKVTKKIPKAEVSSMEECQADSLNLNMKECDICHIKLTDLINHQCVVQSISPDEQPSTSIPEKIGIPHCTFNSRTGKRICKVCSKEFLSMGGFRRHYVRVHLIEIRKCSFCNTNLRSRFHLKRHVQLQHPEHFFKCKFCPKYFFHAEKLTEHEGILCANKRLKEQKAEIGKTGPGPIPEDPNESQTGPPVLEVVEGGNDEEGNISMDPKSKKFKCGSCSKIFRLKHHAHNHYKTFHLKIRYKCDMCEKEFFHEQNFRRHRSRVHLGLKFKCSSCNQPLASKEALIEHQAKGTCSKRKRVRPKEPKELAKCETCNKEFKRISHLNEHVKHVHLKIRDHLCSQCGQGFSRHSNLTYHIESVHSERRDHLCDICGKEFNRRSHLLGHRRRVHKEAVESVEAVKLAEAVESVEAVKSVEPVKSVEAAEANVKAEAEIS